MQTENSAAINTASLLSANAISTSQPTREQPLTRQHPGRLETGVDFLLYTQTAQRCFNEGWGKTMSVVKFAHRMRKIWQAAAQDDPYADLCLLRVHDTIVQVRREFEKLKEKYTKVLEAEEELHVRLNTAKPLMVSLQFGTPYGYMVGYMLKDYDRLARCVLSAHHLGLTLNERPTLILRKARSLMRKVFTKARGWQKTQVTRQDIQQQTPRAEKATRLMGKLNEKVLTGQLRAFHAPAIRTRAAKKAAIKE